MAVVQIMFLPHCSPPRALVAPPLLQSWSFCVYFMYHLFNISKPRMCYDSSFTFKSQESVNQSAFVREMQVYALHNLVGSSPVLVK